MTEKRYDQAPSNALLVRDSTLFVESDEIISSREELYSRGNKRLAELSRHRRAKKASPDAINNPTALAQHWLSQLDSARVEEGVFLCESPSERDLLAALVQEGQGRIQAFTLLDPLQTWSPENLRHDVARGFCGLNLLPTLQHFHSYDKRSYALYEMCEQAQVPVRLRFGWSESIFTDLRYANPLDLQPVARDFPDVTFIVPSFGSGMIRELLMLGASCPNVLTDTSGSAHWLAFLPGRWTIANVVSRVLDVFGPQRLLFASNSGLGSASYKQEMLNSYRKIFADLNVSEDDARLIFGENLNCVLRDVDRTRTDDSPQKRLHLGKHDDSGLIPAAKGGQNLP